MSNRNSAGVTILEVACLITVVLIVLVILLPTIMGARQRADRAVCLGNLKEMAKMAMLYAQENENVLPVAHRGAPAYLSIRKLIESQSGLKPGLFVCPSSETTEADVDADGRFTLTAENCSYSWIREECTLARHGQALASDESVRDLKWAQPGNHADGMNVVFVDTTAEWWPLERLPEGRRLPAGLIGND